MLHFTVVYLIAISCHKKRMRIHLLGLLCVFIRQVSTVVLLYETKNQRITQSFDCIYYGGRGTLPFSQSIGYCIRLENDTRLERNFSSGCQNDGVAYTYDRLMELNLSYTELLSWSSNVDAVDRYQTYLSIR